MFDKILNWIVKLAGLIITAPVTWIVAGDVFGDIQGGIRWIVQGAAVLLVEGVFLANWLALEQDKKAESAYKIQRAATAVGLYVGLWVLAWVHGEGAAGVVFRAALGAALLKSVWDAGVYDILRANRSTDRDIDRNWRVQLIKRTEEVRTRVLHYRLTGKRDRKVVEAEHVALLATAQEDVKLQQKRMLAEVNLEHKERNQELAQKDKKLSVTDKFPYPIEKARGHEDERRQLSKEESIERLIAILANNPDVNKTDLAEHIGRARNTLYDYIEELVAIGVIEQANTASGYRVTGVTLTPSGNSNGQH